MGTPRATMVLPVHGITRYLRVRITTYDDVLVIEDRRSLFGLIPLWRRRMEVANGEISSGEVHNVVRATFTGLLELKDPVAVARMRGKELAELEAAATQ